MTAEERTARTALADEACREAYRSAGGPIEGVALVAVGGFGRGELAPWSDLDVVLVHADGVDVGDLASELWYPLWDAGHKVDHSVRTVSEMMKAAEDDPRVALGLLDARHLAGDTHLALRLRAELLAEWRRTARARLVELRELSFKRHEVVGELAHLSVPDIKESAGGLRDAVVLKALVATWLVEVPHADLERCRAALLDVRDHVHTLAGRALDRIQPEMWAPLAEALGLPDAEAAQKYVRRHGRRLAHLTRLTWHRVSNVLAQGAEGAEGADAPAPWTETVARGVAVRGSEVVLDGTVDPAADPVLLLRCAALASERGLVLEPTTASRLLKEAPALPTPWPREARSLVVRLLAGSGLLGVWETLEETGALEQVLPEWEQIRLLPHASVIHRFTVDRHVVETCIEAAKLIRRVERADLLMVSALLHDIGKGSGLDHSVAGEGAAREVALRMGFSAEDADTVATLVRWHLLLPTVATGRDLEDPVTLEEVTCRIRTPEEVQLLAALTEADSLAASAKAWTSWRSRLVGDLVVRVTSVLTTGAPRAMSPAEEADALGEIRVPLAVRSGNHAAEVTVQPSELGSLVRFVAKDRVGLLADVAATLAVERVSVRAARAWSQRGRDGTEWGVSEWEVDAQHLEAPAVRQRFEMVAQGRTDVRRLARVPADALSPVVTVRPGASRSATVLEVRAGDRPGVLHQVLRAVADLHMTVRSAHVDTVGPQAVDVFYLCELGAEVLSEPRAAEAAHAVRAVLTPTG